MLKVLLFSLSFLSLISCGVQNHSAVLDGDGGPGDDVSVFDNDLFGPQGILPVNQTETQRQNVLILMKGLTSGGLYAIANRLGDKHIIHSLRKQLARAENEATAAKKLLSSTERLAEVGKQQTALAKLQESITQAERNVKLAEATVENSSTFKTRSALSAEKRALKQLVSQRTSINKLIEELLNKGGTISDEVVHATRTAAAEKVTNLRQKVHTAAVDTPIGGTGLRKVFRRIAFIGGLLVAVDAGAHAYILHGLNLEPQIYPTAQAAQIFGKSVQDFLSNNFDFYSTEDDTDYEGLLQ